jgi:hypothetical protein
MGWCIGKKTVHKLHNDKYGKNGTEARLLVRYATTYDTKLQIHPKTGPKPPGFNTISILKPGCDMYNTVNKTNITSNNINFRKGHSKGVFLGR